MDNKNHLLNICKTESLSSFLGSVEENNIYVLREDLIPYFLGGNKVIIGIKYFEDMKNKGCDCMVAYGRPQSNLCRVLSSICKNYNIPYHIITPIYENDQDSLNGKIAEMMNAKIHKCEQRYISSTIQEVINVLKCQGFKPYYIYGNMYGNGNEEVPVSAYAERYINVLHNTVEKNDISIIVLSCGTGMTMAGLAVGVDSCGDNVDIVGISVARKASVAYDYYDKYYASYKEKVIRQSLGKRIITDDYLAGGYGLYNKDVENTIFEVYQKFGIPLDPTYTGKAFWGMKEWLRKGRIIDKNIMFIHTGGIPIWFDYILERS